MNNNKIFIFPGQGVQYVGMGKDIFTEFAVARHVYEEISDIYKKDVRKICFDGPQNLLNKPDNTSLGIFANSVAIARVIETKTDKPLHSHAYAITGHSMGQYSALYHTGSLSMKDAIEILAERSSYMSLSGVQGGMGCIIGLQEYQVREALRASVNLGYAEISNHNAIDQFVISGENKALNAVLESARNLGAIIAMRLNVEIPAHCALMNTAETMLRNHLTQVEVKSPKTKWFSNHTADLMSEPSDIKEALAHQMTHGVRWYEIMQKLPEHKITTAYEIGPGQTLSKLINRAEVSCVANPINNAKNLHKILDELQKAK